MARVTDADVIEILDTTVTSFTPYISVANSLVTLTLATPAKITNANLLKEIERWLAAHFFKCAPEQQEKTHKVGETEATFMGNANQVGLSATLYGQQAIAMDTSGTLATLGKRIARFDTILAISDAETP